MFNFKGIHHVAISVPSLAAAKVFYVEKLGLELADEDYVPASDTGDKVTQLENAECHLMMVKAGNIFLEIFEFHNPTPNQQQDRPLSDHGYTHFACEVEDIQISYDLLAKAGVLWHHRPIESIEGYWMAYGRDPFGNVIEIQKLGSGRSYSFDQLS